MLDIVKNSVARNGNGAGSVNGRGVLRRKLTPAARIALAADIATGAKHLDPSLKQAAAATGVSPYLINKELKARAAHEAWAERKRQEVQRANAILGAWTQASDTERAMAVRAIGVVDVWNTIASIVA